MKWKKVLILFVSLGLILILLTQINIKALWSQLKGVSPWVYVLSLAFFIISYIFKGLRFKILFHNKPSLWQCFHIVCVHNATVQILPSNIGEVSFVYLYSKHEKIPKSQAVATLLGGRLIDVVVILLIFIASSLFLANIFDNLINILISTMVIAFGAFIVFASKYHATYVRWMKAIVKALRIAKFRYVKKGVYYLTETLQYFSNLRSSKILIMAFIVTIIHWGFLFTTNWILIRLMGFNLSMAHVVIAGTVSMVAGFLPTHTAGGFGTFEASWAGILVLMGIQKEVAINSGFLIHIVKFITFSILAIYATLVLRKKKLS